MRDSKLSVQDARHRRGAAALEMALVLGLLILLVFGIIEMGRAIMVNQVITNAAREGARRAVIPGATNQQVQDRVTGYLDSASITGYTQTIQVNGSPGDLSSAPAHAEIQVAVSVPYSDVSYGVMNLISPDRTFIARVNMRKE
ncbi:MAG: pilus assembly protein [Pirellulaceae bacterium]|nr:pilus assembly protein [Pirellulaceae bacterium]